MGSTVDAESASDFLFYSQVLCEGFEYFRHKFSPIVCHYRFTKFRNFLQRFTKYRYTKFRDEMVFDWVQLSMTAHSVVAMGVAGTKKPLPLSLTLTRFCTTGFLSNA